MFIKLRAKRFWGRLTVQERGAGFGDIFTQNTLSAIKAVCQVLGLRLCGWGRGQGSGKGGWRGAIPRGDHRTNQSSAAGGLQHADALTDVVSYFLLVLLYEHCSHLHPAQVTSHFLLVWTRMKTNLDVFTQLTRTNSHIVHLIDTSCTVRDEVVHVSPTDSHHTIIRNTHPCCMGFLC